MVLTLVRVTERASLANLLSATAAHNTHQHWLATVKCCQQMYQFNDKIMVIEKTHWLTLATILPYGLTYPCVKVRIRLTLVTILLYGLIYPCYCPPLWVNLPFLLSSFMGWLTLALGLGLDLPLLLSSSMGWLTLVTVLLYGLTYPCVEVMIRLTLVTVFLYGLLEGCDVLDCDENKDNHILLIPHRTRAQQQPKRSSCHTHSMLSKAYKTLHNYIWQSFTLWSTEYRIIHTLMNVVRYNNYLLVSYNTFSCVR